MTRSTRLTAALAGAALGWLVPQPAGAQALATPDGWKTSVERFVAMPPGFHVTTSGSVLLYHPDAGGQGEYSVESNGFLFPGESSDSYGVFIGGRDLDSDDAVWTALEIGTDGTWAVRQRSEGQVTDVLGPATGPIVAPEGDSTGENLLRIDVGGASVSFLVNGETVAELPQADISVEGVVGFRVGSDLNIHVTTLDIISGDTVRRFAPSPEDDS